MQRLRPVERLGHIAEYWQKALVDKAQRARPANMRSPSFTGQWVTKRDKISEGMFVN